MNIAEAAKKLIEEVGLPVIPLCPHTHAGMSEKHQQRCACAGKSPLIAGWPTHSKTTANDLALWQQQFRAGFNIGMPLGDASGYCGIDVDGEAGVTYLMELSGGNLPATWEFSTAAGSRLLYIIPDGLCTKKFKQSGPGPHEECAILCTGQQTVLPPSVHHTGAQYAWIEGHSPFDIPCAIAPKWLVDLIRDDSGVESSGRAEPKASPPNPPGTPGFAHIGARSNTGSNIDTRLDFAGEFLLGEDGDAEAEFEPEMSFDVPAEAPAAKEPKNKKHKVVVTEDMLTQRIPEGSRDATMTAIVGHYCANRDLRRLGKEMLLNVCLQHNEQYCDPPLDRQAIIDKVNYFFDVEAGKDAQFASKKATKPSFEASVMASRVLEYLQERGIILHFDQFSKLYYYTSVDEGPWKCTRNTTIVTHWIRDVVISPQYGDPSWDKRSYVEETRIALEEHFTSPFKTVSDFDLGAHSEELSKYIVCGGALLDWQTGEVLPWDPAYKTTLAFDVQYNADATCPSFEQYLSEWLPDEDVRAVVQEFLGYCLIPNTNFRKALFLYGRGRNGKSIFVEFFKEFFKDLSSTLSYDALFQRFGPANLKDKLVNIYDDTNVSFTKDTGIAKNLIAGGHISAEFKGKDHFTFSNIARIIFSAQETPRTSDTSLAWYDRWFFVKFPNTFRTSNAKKEEMMNAMRAEISGILNWMIEGLRRLIAQDGFTESALLDTYTLEYRGLNDNVVSFLSNYCCRDSDEGVRAQDRVSARQLYRIYELVSERDNVRCFSKKMFTMRVEEAGYPARYGRVQNNRTRYFSGLYLNKESELVQELMLEINVILNTD